MAERLGTGLQNLVQRFDSAWHLKETPWTYVRGAFCGMEFAEIKGTGA